MEKFKLKGWCPSLEKPMETGDGLLVRIPIKFGELSSDIVQQIAELAGKYGNGNLDLSARGNLQLRGVTPETYRPLREGLACLGFERDFSLQIITSPFDKKAREIAEELRIKSAELGVNLAEKFLIVIDSGGWFPLSAIPCDLYIKSEQANIPQILSILQNTKKYSKKPADEKALLPPLGFIPFSEQSGVVSLAVPFGRLKIWLLIELASLADEFSGGKIILAPFRRVILPNIAYGKAEKLIQAADKIGFITRNSDSRLNIHACVGAPDCSSALGNTRNIAEKWAKEHPNLTQIVHITGCAKGCAYKGKADITITATTTGYEIEQ